MNNVKYINGTNARSYVYYSDKTILFDTGTPGSGKKIINYFNERNERPDIVLITHYHYDHIGGLSKIKELYNPEIYADENEIPVITGINKMKMPKTIPGRLVSALANFRPVSDIKKTDDLNIDNIKILKTPGHTPGSTSYIIENEKIIVSGDAIFFKNNIYKINRSFTLDVKMAINSMNIISQYHGYKVMPGHGNEFILK